MEYAAPTRDAELLDSYSRTITGVVGQVAEAVVHIQVQKPVAEGRGREGQQGRGRDPGRDQTGGATKVNAGVGFGIHYFDGWFRRH